MSRTRPFRPRLHAMEGRALPSCLVYVRDDTLFVRGDEFGNDVRLEARGALVSVTCDQAPTVTADGIHRIVADLDGGADRFEAVRSHAAGQGLAAPPLLLRLATGGDGDVANLDWAAGGQDSIWIDLGWGDDQFDARLIPPPDPEGNIPSPDPEVPATASVRLSVHGGAGLDRITSRMGIQPTPFTPSTAFDVTADGGPGDDTLAAEADVLPTSTQATNLPPVRPSASFAVALNGGLGDDDVSARMGIEPTPFLPVVDFDLDLDGGAGNDFLSLNSHVDPISLFAFNPQPEPPTVNFNAALRGGAGNDRITSRMGIEPTPFAPPAIECALALDGGAGNDVLDAEFTAGATQQKVADLRVALSGGDGSDALRLVWDAAAFDADACADGGAGFDLGIFSPGVRHVNVERLG